MRADRLLSILFLLQNRGSMTAEQLAIELEVSRRTIYRDVQALSVAGVPIYANHGPGGGYALLDSYRTQLTGLTEAEVRALLILSVPAPLAELGLDQELKMALRKVSAALPSIFRGDEGWVRQRIHLDGTWWFQGGEVKPALRVLHEAIREDKCVRIHYKPWFNAPAELEQLVEPYGLVAKAGVWYLVYRYAGRLRVRRVSELLDARLADDEFQRPADFDLPAFWRSWCAQHEEEKRPRYPVTLRLAPELLPLLSRQSGDGFEEALEQAVPDEEGWIIVTLHFESLDAARARLLSYGRAAEVLAPEALRRSIVDFARQIGHLYSPSRPEQG